MVIDNGGYGESDHCYPSSGFATFERLAINAIQSGYQITDP